MPKKKNHNHGHGQGKSKKKQKYKPSPAEAPKKDEDEKIAVSDHVQDNSSPVPDAPPKDEIAPPQLENPGTNADESSGDEHVDVQPKDSPEAPCNERPREQESPVPLTATVPLEVGAPEPQRPILSDISQPEPNSGVSPMPVEVPQPEPKGGVAPKPVVAMVDPVPKPALSQRPWLPPIPTGPCSVPGFAFTTAPSLRAPFRPQQQPPYSAAFRSFPENARPTRAIKRETAELPAVPVVSTPTCPESVLKHPLANKWTLWWFSQSDPKADWESCQKPVLTVSTVEDFWALYHHIQRVSELQNGNDYSFFKEGIRPMWEHDCNRYGGRWLYSLDWKREGLNRKDSDRADQCWLNALLLLIGENYGDDNMRRMVNGVVMNLRKMDKLAIWMNNVDEMEEICEFGRYFQRAIGASPRTLIFEAHQDAMVKRGSTGKATYRI